MLLKETMIQPTTINNCKLVSLPKITDPRGNLSFIENKHIPFEIKRVFYIYDVPSGESRGAHAHKELQQFIICLSGSFDIRFDDGEQNSIVHLNRPWQGFYIPPMIWAAEINFSPGTACLILASELYNEIDYIRSYDEFILVKQKSYVGKK